MNWTAPGPLGGLETTTRHPSVSDLHRIGANAEGLSELKGSFRA
jgi:hypothetical protein